MANTLFTPAGVHQPKLLPQLGIETEREECHLENASLITPLLIRIPPSPREGHKMGYRP